MNVQTDIVTDLLNQARWTEEDAAYEGPSPDTLRAAAAEITKLRAERDDAAREMRERCAGWHDAQATICRDVAKANQGNEVGPVFHALVVDHEVAADAIRALPDVSSVVVDRKNAT
jgi:hypothetical protein